MPATSQNPMQVQATLVLRGNYFPSAVKFTPGRYAMPPLCGAVVPFKGSAYFFL
jgi:hypothetical protein